mgnify:FL=1
MKDITENITQLTKNIIDNKYTKCGEFILKGEVYKYNIVIEKNMDRCLLAHNTLHIKSAIVKNDPNIGFIIEVEHLFGTTDEHFKNISEYLKFNICDNVVTSVIKEDVFGKTLLIKFQKKEYANGIIKELTEYYNKYGR